MKKSVPGCLWATEKLLVCILQSHPLTLPSALLADLCAAGVDCVLLLLGRDQSREAGADTLFALNSLSRDTTTPGSKIFVGSSLWPEGDELPSTRRMRLTLDDLDDFFSFGLTVFVHGAGVPARAVMTAACWLARDGGEAGEDADPEVARLGWLRRARGVNARTAQAVTLNDAQRAFVCDWPAGRHAEPVLGVTELLDETEHYPTATVEYWLRTLPTVRVHPEGCHGHFFVVPVEDAKRVSNGSINLELADLHAGTWIGERTLRLLDGTRVVFIASSMKQRS